MWSKIDNGYYLNPTWDALPAAAAVVFNYMILDMGMFGGRKRRLSLAHWNAAAIARRLRCVSEEDVFEAMRALEDDGKVIVDAGVVRLRDFADFQADPTAADRQARFRDRSAATRNVTQSNADDRYNESNGDSNASERYSPLQNNETHSNAVDDGNLVTHSNGESHSVTASNAKNAKRDQREERDRTERGESARAQNEIDIEVKQGIEAIPKFTASNANNRYSGQWDPPDPRGFEATWRWREDLPDAVHAQIAHLEMPARGWAARILWYWPALAAQDAVEIAVQVLKLYATQGVDIRAELAKAAGARGRADGTHGLRRFLASWMGRSQVDVARLRSRPRMPSDGPTRPIPPPAAEVVPPDPERTPEEEAECRRLAAEFARQIQGIPAQGPEPAHVEEVRAAVLGDDEMSPAQRAEFEAMAARARRKARALEGPDLATAGALAAEFLTGGER